MTAFIRVTIRDHSGELSVVALPVSEMSALTVWGDTLALGATLAAAVMSLSLGVMVNWSFSQDAGQHDQDYPADDAAQRETALRVFYHGNTSGKKGYVTVPAADLANVELQQASDLAILTEEPVASFVTDFEAGVTIAIPSEIGGYWNDEVTVDKIQFVGRNN